MAEDFDVVVIGTGIIGAAIAFELADRGRRVVGVDKLAAPGHGSTSNSCAIVRAGYSTWDGVAMAYESFSYWRGWKEYVGGADDETDLARYVRCGTVQLTTAHDDQWRKVRRHYDAIGVPYEYWDLDTLLTRLPVLDPSSFHPPRRPSDPSFWDDPVGRLLGAIYTPGSGYVDDPQLATRNLVTAAAVRGAEFRYNERVVAIERTNGRVAGVTLASGATLRAPVVVNAAGPHSSAVNRMAGVDGDMRITTRSLRHEVHHVPAPAGFDYEHDGTHVSDADTGIYFRPAGGNHILVGSEDPECDPRVWVDDPDDYPRSVTLEAWEAQVLRLARRIPDLPIPSRPRGVVDLYDVSDDWIPIYDRSVLDGFYMAVGTSGNQFKNAPVVGHCMAELMEAIESGADHDAVPVKVEQRHTGLTLDMGFYSRRREINPDSSFSVNG